MAEISFNEDSLLITESDIYKIALLEFEKKYEYGKAYLQDSYFYLYRGTVSDTEAEFIASNGKPGIYEKKDGTYIIVPPRNEAEQEYYKYDGKISSINPTDVINVVNSKDDLVITVPESNKIFNPTLADSDDILKRLIKQALIQKGVDIDQYKDRFENKNSLFNFKQVIKGDKNVSILIFSRGCEALNLKFTITLEEIDPERCIGTPLNGALVASSEDTFEI